MYKWISNTMSDADMLYHTDNLSKLVQMYPTESLESYTEIYNSINGTDLKYVETSVSDEEDSTTEDNLYLKYLDKFGRDMEGIENAPLILIGFLLSGDKNADDAYLYLLGLNYIATNYDLSNVIDYSEFVIDNFNKILKNSTKVIDGLEVHDFYV